MSFRSKREKGPVGPSLRESGEKASSEVSTDRLKRLVFDRTLNVLDFQGRGDWAEATGLRETVSVVIDDVLQEQGVKSPPEALRKDLHYAAMADLTGFGPLQRLMEDETVSDILVNGPEEVWIDRGGVLEQTPVRFADAAHLHRILDRMVASHGRHLEEATPYADIRLEDGSRLHAVIPPLTQCGPVLSIRKRRAHPFTLDDLVSAGSMSSEMSDFLRAAVSRRCNLLVSGGAGAGKTTLLSVLGGFIPESERVVTIEETLELELAHPHVISLESRPASTEGRGEITLRTLLKNALRMRADRIIVGEVRGSEVFDMLQAMNVGHPGSMTTLHANSPEDAFRRLETLLLLSGIELPGKSLENLSAHSFDVLVQLDRDTDGRRRITQIVEIQKQGKEWSLQPIFSYDPGSREFVRSTPAEVIA